MNLNQIEYFVAACDKGSVSGAAKKVSVTPQTVSSAIAALEGELGVVLLARTPQGVRITHAGMSVAPLARRVLDDVAQMRRAADEARQDLSGSVTFVHMAEPLISKADDFLAQVLREFGFVHHGVRVEALQAQHDAVVYQVAHGEADLGLVSLVPGDQNVESRLVFSSELRLFVPEGHRLYNRDCVSFADLADEELPPIAGASWPTFAIRERCAAFGFKPRFSDTASSFMEELARCETIGLIPACHEVLATAQPHRVIPFEAQEAIPLQARLVTRRGCALSPAARLFADALTEALNDPTGTYEEIGAGDNVSR